MICPNCGNEIPDGFRFCTICGTNLSSEQQAPVMPEPILEQTPDFPENTQLPVQNYVPTSEEYLQTYEDMPDSTAEYADAQEGFVPTEYPPQEYASNYPGCDPDPMQMPEQAYTPVPVEAPAKEKRSGGFMKILPWILVGLLVIGAGVGGFFFYRAYNKLADQRDQFYFETDKVKKDMDSLQQDYDSLSNEYEEAKDTYSTRLSEKNDQISSLNDKINDLELISDNYNDIIWAADSYAVGGTSTFGASPAVITMGQNDGSKYFTLYTDFSGKTITMNSSGYSASAEFTEDQWSGSTSIKVTPDEPGITTLTFSLDDGAYSAFAVIIIVTE